MAALAPGERALLQQQTLVQFVPEGAPPPRDAPNTRSDKNAYKIPAIDTHLVIVEDAKKIRYCPDTAAAFSSSCKVTSTHGDGCRESEDRRALRVPPRAGNNWDEVAWPYARRAWTKSR